MTKIAKLIRHNGWTVAALSRQLNCSRYLLRQLVEDEPSTGIQRRLAEEVIEVLNTYPNGPTDAAALPASKFIGRGIPIFGDIPAGPLTLTDGLAHSDDLAPVSDLDPKQHFAVRVFGTSMEPLFHARDILICRRVEGVAMPAKQQGPTPVHAFTRYDGRVICGLVDGTETTLKRLEIAKTGRGDADYEIVLKPINPNHPPITISAKNSFAIQGEVVRMIRDV